VIRALRATLLSWFLVTAALVASTAQADQQLDPALKDVIARAISQAECFTERDERLEILKQVYCETHRPGESRLPPGLVMAVMEVESRFDRWAVSSAGAVGLMQVMPFWPGQLGIRRYELVHIGPNIHMGCAILRYYLRYERNDVRKALARYNGSIGQRDYPDTVISRWSRWNGADDLGFGQEMKAKPTAQVAPRQAQNSH
jgi:soluble lytic murein transglycosylase-like protein